MSRTETTNTFTEGLVMDINPLVAPSNGLSNALNATLITRNGNENVLQNDMGNGRVGTALLPSGYIPVGTCELGGIVYIVSYNPNTDKCLIGSFPSPERNKDLSSKKDPAISVSELDFKKSNIISNTIVKKLISNNVLYPGDKFIVCAERLKANEDVISGVEGNQVNSNGTVNLKLATIDNNGRIIYLSNLIKYKVGGKYFYLKDGAQADNLDEYRNMVNSAYNTFTSKVAGKLYVIAELETIDSFIVNWRLVDITEDKKNPNKEVYKIVFTIKTKSARNNYISYIKLVKDGDTKLELSVVEYYEYNKEGDKEVDAARDILQITISESFDKNTPRYSKKYIFTPCMSFGIIELFETTIAIDYSLFLTGQVLNTIWNYYKDNESNLMSLTFDLATYFDTGNDVTNLDVFYIPYNEVTSDMNLETKLPGTYAHTLCDIREGASGIFKNDIKFDSKFIADNLYLAVIRVTAQILDSPKHYYICKCLYTNGIYNKYSNEDTIDLDKVPIRLQYDLSFPTNNWDKIVLSSTLNIPKLYNSIKTNELVGELKTNISLNTNSYIRLDISNKYNTFALRGESSYTIHRANIINKKLSYNGTKIGTSNSISVELLTNNGKLNDIIDKNSKLDWYEISYSIKDKSLKLNGAFFDKVASGTVKRNVTVNNLFTPIASTEEEFNKYGLTYLRGKFEFIDYLNEDANNYIGLALTNCKNQNTEPFGNLRHSLLRTSLIGNAGYIANKTAPELVSNNLDETNITQGFLNYTDINLEDPLGSRYPDSFGFKLNLLTLPCGDYDLFDNHIDDSNITNKWQKFLFIPILIHDATLSDLDLMGWGSSPSYFDIYTNNIYSGNIKIADIAKKDFVDFLGFPFGQSKATFSAKLKYLLGNPLASPFKTFWIFVKSKVHDGMEERNTYIPLNSFFKIKNLDLDTYINNVNTSIPEVIASFLLSTFVCHKKGLSQDVYTPNNVLTYYNDLFRKVTFTTECLVLPRPNSIYFKGESMEIILNNFKQFVLNTESLSITGPGGTYSFDTDLLIPTKKYLNFKDVFTIGSNTLKIPSFIQSPFLDVPLIDLNNKSKEILGIDNGTLTEDNCIFPKVIIEKGKFKLFDSRNLPIILGTLSQKIRDLFLYDEVKEELTFNSDYVQSNPALYDTIKLTPLLAQGTNINTPGTTFKNYEFINPVQKMKE